MKTKNLLVYAAGLLLLIGLIVAAVFIVLPKLKAKRSGEEAEEQLDRSNSILFCVTEDDVESYISRNKIPNEGEPSYFHDEEGYYFIGADILGYDGECEIQVDNGRINIILASIQVFPDLEEMEQENNAESDEEGAFGDEEEQVPEYKGFTDDEKATIQDSFMTVEKAIVEYLQCRSPENYDYTPARIPANGENIPESIDEAFFNGYYLREFSVRDEQGVLWIVRYLATYGIAKVKILKILDETGYDGFIPTIDMTKTYE